VVRREVGDAARGDGAAREEDLEALVQRELEAGEGDLRGRASAREGQSEFAMRRRGRSGAREDEWTRGREGEKERERGERRTSRATVLPNPR